VAIVKIFGVLDSGLFPKGASNRQGLKWPGHGEVALAEDGEGEGQIGDEGQINLIQALSLIQL
jgi:hypothetical protein